MIGTFVARSTQTVANLSNPSAGTRGMPPAVAAHGRNRHWGTEGLAQTHATTGKDHGQVFRPG